MNTRQKMYKEWIHWVEMRDRYKNRYKTSHSYATRETFPTEVYLRIMKIWGILEEYIEDIVWNNVSNPELLPLEVFEKKKIAWSGILAETIAFEIYVNGFSEEEAIQRVVEGDGYHGRTD